jgi:hypothetical protein
LSELRAEQAEEGLRRAIDAVDADVARIELWLLALTGFTQPAPGYDFDAGIRRAAMRR